MAQQHQHTRWVVAVGFGIAGALVVGVLVLAFVWPSATARARGLPIGIAGPATQVAQLQKAVADQDPAPIMFERVGSRAEAVQRIRNRTEYGAILLGTHSEVLTASAGSAATNQILRGIQTTLQGSVDATVERGLTKQLQQVGAAAAAAGKSAAIANKALGEARAAVAQGRTPTFPSASSASSASSLPSAAAAPATSAASLPTVTIVDVVPLSKDDPTGGGLNAAAFPIVLGGLLGGILIALLVVGVVRRLLALAVYAVAAGALTAVILQTMLHTLQRDWLANAGAIGLSMLATAAVVVGCNALLGTVGIPVGAVLSTLVGNPLSGAAFPYQFIPQPWGEVGQNFVAGAAANLVRSLSYFPDAATGHQWLVLGAWVVGGVLLAVLGHFRSVVAVRLPERELERETVPTPDHASRHGRSASPGDEPDGAPRPHHRHRAPARPGADAQPLPGGRGRIAGATKS